MWQSRAYWLINWISCPNDEVIIWLFSHRSKPKNVLLSKLSDGSYLLGNIKYSENVLLFVPPLKYPLHLISYDPRWLHSTTQLTISTPFHPDTLDPPWRPKPSWKNILKVFGFLCFWIVLYNPSYLSVYPLIPFWWLFKRCINNGWNIHCSYVHQVQPWVSLSLFCFR